MKAGRLFLAGALIILAHNAMAQAPVNLGSASNFAVLAGSAITVAASGTTTITGDIGSYPTPAITGTENLALTGINHGNDAFSEAAQNDLFGAYGDAAGRAYDFTYVDGYDLVGSFLGAGVYNSPASLALSGTLTLNGGGDPNAVWIFQAGSTLITASGSIVSLINGAQASHVFWQVGSSATLGTGTDFAGNILALTSITLNTGASVEGRVLAHNGAVTLDYNGIALPAGVPEPGTLQLLGSGLAALLAFRRGKNSR
jgi:hypothetical protein